MFEIDRLNERFIKDFALKMKPNIAYTPYFYERLEQYELYKPGTLKQYEDFKEYITSTYRDMDEYYDERNKFIQSIIKDQENLQDKYGIKGNALKEYNIGKYDFGSKNIYNMENINVQMISIDLKSASFQALRYFNKKIVRNTDSYPEYVSFFTDKKYFDNKRIRSGAFGKTCNKQIEKLEKYITEMILKAVLKYQDASTVKCFNHDEVIFLKTDKSSDVLKEVQKLSKDIDVIFDIEQYTLTPIIGSDGGFVKEITDLKTGEKRNDFVGLNSNHTPFAICALTNTKIEDNFLYFIDQDGYLCKMIEHPEFKIEKEIEIER